MGPLRHNMKLIVFNLLQGPLAFYKGFLPNFGRLGSWNVIMFLTLEQVRIWIWFSLYLLVNTLVLFREKCTHTHTRKREKEGGGFYISFYLSSVTGFCSLISNGRGKSMFLIKLYNRTNKPLWSVTTCRISIGWVECWLIRNPFLEEYFQCWTQSWMIILTEIT